MKVYILQGQISTLACIAEIHMFKVDISIRHFRDSICSILHLRHFLKHLRDTVCRRLSNHDHRKHECDHHQRHQNLERIYNDTCQFSCLHGPADNVLSSDQYHDNDDCIHHELHDRRVPCHDLLRLCKELKYKL